MILLITFITIMGLLLALYNGYIFAMALPGKRDPHYNKLLHRAGWLIRLSVWCFSMVTGVLERVQVNDLVWLSLYSLLWFWPVFNIIYAKINDEQWLYVGSENRYTASWFDRKFRKFTVPGYILTLLLTVFWYPLDILYFFSNVLMESFRERPVSWAVVAGLIIISWVLVRRIHLKRKAS